jgi:hypothetical protein
MENGLPRMAGRGGLPVAGKWFAPTSRSAGKLFAKRLFAGKLFTDD